MSYEYIGKMTHDEHQRFRDTYAHYLIMTSGSLDLGTRSGQEWDIYMATHKRTLAHFGIWQEVGDRLVAEGEIDESQRVELQLYTDGTIYLQEPAEA